LTNECDVETKIIKTDAFNTEHLIVYNTTQYDKLKHKIVLYEKYVKYGCV
jgi:hypothetical protein